MIRVIEAVATLVFEPQSGLLILGDLEVKGTEENPVTFRHGLYMDCTALLDKEIISKQELPCHEKWQMLEYHQNTII
jgi:hypothetical protein